MNERPDAERIKAQLAAEIVRIIAEQRVGDAEACVRLQLTEDELRRVRSTELGDVSIEVLIKALGKLEQQVSVAVAPTLQTRTDRRPIREEIDEIVAGIPSEEFDRLPTDLAANVDHCLYGTPRRDW